MKKKESEFKAYNNQTSKDTTRPVCVTCTVGSVSNTLTGHILKQKKRFHSTFGSLPPLSLVPHCPPPFSLPLDIDAGI